MVIFAVLYPPLQLLVWWERAGCVATRQSKAGGGITRGPKRSARRASGRDRGGQATERGRARVGAERNSRAARVGVRDADGGAPPVDDRRPVGEWAAAFFS